MIDSTEANYHITPQVENELSIETENNSCAATTYKNILKLNIESHMGNIAIVHPKKNYEQLVDEVRLALVRNNIDPSNLLRLYDERTNTLITKELWILEMHETDSIKVVYMMGLITVVVLFQLIVSSIFIFVLFFWGVIHYEKTGNDVFWQLFFVYLITQTLSTFVTWYLVAKHRHNKQIAAQSLLYPNA